MVMISPTFLLFPLRKSVLCKRSYHIIIAVEMIALCADNILNYALSFERARANSKGLKNLSKGLNNLSKGLIIPRLGPRDSSRGINYREQ